MKQNNITFTSFDGNTLRRTKKVGNTANYGLSIEDFVDNEQIPSLINSLEIDWNGAEVIPGKTLNTTGEMLSILKTAYNYATTYTGKTTLTTNSSVLGTINGQSLKYGGSITIETGSDYTLPTASSTILGGIKVGSNLSINSNGVLSATDTKYNNATTSYAGLMSYTDKAKLDAIDLNEIYEVFEDLSYSVDSMYSIIENLEHRVNALYSNINYEVTAQLSNCTCPSLANLKTIKPDGGTFTVTCSITGYRLPQQITVTNADYTWDYTSGILKISTVRGNLSVTITATENKPDNIQFYRQEGDKAIVRAHTITGTNESIISMVKVTSTDGTLTANNSKFKFTEIGSNVSITNYNTGAPMTTDKEYPNNTIICIKGEDVSTSINKVVVSSTVISITDDLAIRVEEGTVTGISISPTSYEYNGNGGDHTFTASLRNNMFNPPTSGFTWTLEGNDFSKTNSISKSIKITAAKNTSTSATKSGKLTVTYGDYSAEASLTIKAATVSTKYYWYVGQTNPASMTSISPIVTENGVTGWRETGSVLTATYEYNSTDYPISSNPSQNSMWYYALPENTGLGAFDAQNENYAVNPISSVTINGVKYNIYEGGASRKFNALTIKNK